MNTNVYNSREYSLILDFLDQRKATRSGVPYINHINEGLILMRSLGHSYESQVSYCLHPIVQSDEDLAAEYFKRRLANIDSYHVMLVMEYRNIANAYLSTRRIKNIDEIKLSPIKDVNDMLIADKIQNRKDFEIHHLGKHPRSKELAQYFSNWLHRLGVTEEQYKEYIFLLKLSAQ